MIFTIGSAPRKLRIVIASVLLNLSLALINIYFQFPLFLDSIGTAVTAALLGPAAGVLTALLTQFGLEAWFGFNWMYAPWIICSIATALIVGVAVERGFFSDALSLSVVILLVTFANALPGALLHVLLYHGFADHGTDLAVQSLQLITGNRILAAFWTRIPINILDKGIAILIAFLATLRWGGSAENPPGWGR